MIELGKEAEAIFCRLSPGREDRNWTCPAFATKTDSSVTYLDHNATSPLLPQARAAWLEAEERYPGNPSSPHRLGARTEGALDQARLRLAALLGGSPHDVVWTSGATEACNTVLHHIAAMADPTAPVWVSAIEHPAVLESARHYFSIGFG